MGLIIGHRHRRPSSIYRSVLPPSKPPTNQSTKINHLNDVLRSIFAKHDQTTIFDHISLLLLHRSHSSTCFWAHELYAVATFSQSLSLLLFRCTWGSAQIIHSFIPNGRWWTDLRALLRPTVPPSVIGDHSANFLFMREFYIIYILLRCLLWLRKTNTCGSMMMMMARRSFPPLLSLDHLKQGSLIHNIRYISLRKGNYNITIHRVQRYYSNGNTNKFSAGIHTRFLAHILVDALLEVAPFSTKVAVAW